MCVNCKIYVRMKNMIIYRNTVISLKMADQLQSVKADRIFKKRLVSFIHLETSYLHLHFHCFKFKILINFLKYTKLV